MLSDFLKSPVRKKRAYEKSQKKVVRKYQKVSPEFIEEFKKDLAAGWSLGYACRNIINNENQIKKSFDEYPELKKLYDDYILSRNKNNFKSRRN